MYKIKEFEDKYNEEVNQFIISVFVDEYGFEEFRNELNTQNNIDYINNGGKFWVAFDDTDNIIGTIALVKHNKTEVELKKLYVRSDYRGKGLSRELYSKVIETTKEEKYKRIFLSTYDKLDVAVKFYLKRGFTEIKELDSHGNGAKYFELYI